MFMKVKKAVGLFLAICMVFSMMPMSSLNVFAAAAGSGTVNDPYQITTAEDLKTISGSSHYILMNDIALTGEWTPIVSFSGTLDGDGHTISGVNISSTNARNGFIQTLASGGIVKNLILYGSVTCLNTGNCGTQGTGGFVGYNRGTITGCEFHGTVSQRQGDNMCVAGIAGYNAGDISDCKNYGDITGISTGGGYNAAYAGGITGSNHGTVEITNCINYGTISGSVPNTNTNVGDIWGSTTWKSNGAYVGGIAGDTNKTNAPGCSNEGIVVGENTNATAVPLTGITKPSDITISAPISAEQLSAKLPSSVVLTTTEGNRVGTVVWDTSSYDVSNENAAYTFSGTVTLPSTVNNDNNIPLTTTITVTVGSGGTVIPPTESVDYALYFENGKLYKATFDTLGALIKKGEYTEQTDKWSAYDNTLALNGFSFEMASVAVPAALYMSANTKLVLEGENTIKHGIPDGAYYSNGSYGIHSLGAFTIEGSGSLNVSAVDGAIQVEGDLTIHSSITAKATGDADSEYFVCGISSDGNVTITGGTVTALAGPAGRWHESTGIYARNIIINGGTVTASGETFGLETAGSGEITISNTLEIIAGDEAGIAVKVDVYEDQKYVKIMPSPHSHCVCGGSENIGDHTAHSDVNYQPLPSSFTGGTLAAGNYYLTKNITLEQAVTTEGTVNLCLYGYNITFTTDQGQILPGNGSTLNICDCAANQGTISIPSTSLKNTIYFRHVDNATVKMYGGTVIGSSSSNTVTDSDAEHYGLCENCAFYLYGGTVKNDSVAAVGNVQSKVYLYGGTVNSPSNNGVATREDGIIYLCGNTVINHSEGFASVKALGEGCIDAKGYTGNPLTISYEKTNPADSEVVVMNSTNTTTFTLIKPDGKKLQVLGDNLVLALKEYTITLPETQRGYTLTATTGSASTVTHGGSFTFQFALADGYSKTDNFAVKVNGEAVTLNNDGSYTISGITTNTTVTVEGVADTTAPTGEITVGTDKWREFLNNITFGWFFKDTQSVTVTATDPGSGVNKIYYYLAAGAKTEAELTAFEGWTEYTAGFNIAPNNKYVIYAKLVDKAGNTAYINTDGLVLDKVAPALTQNGTAVADNAKYYGDTEFTVSDLYLDTVTVDETEVLPDANGKFTIAADNKDHTIVVTDKAGNSITRTVTVHQYFTITYKTNEGFELGTITYGVTEANSFPTANKLSGLFPEAIAKLKETGSLYVKNPLWYSDEDFTTQAVMPNAPAAGQNYVFYCAFTTSTTITSTQATDHTYGGDLISGYNFSAYYGVEWTTWRDNSDFEFVYEKKVNGVWQPVDDSFKTDLNGDTWDNRIFPKTVADSGIYRIAYIKASVKDNAGNLLFSEYIYPSEVDQEGKQVNVLPRALTISGVTAMDRDYDSTSNVALTGGTLQGLLPNDDVSFTLGSGTMTDANIGTAKAVVTNITLTGEDAGNYILTQPTGITVNITAASQAAPALGKTDETIDGKADGSLSGVNNTMEYRKDGETDYTPITGATVENLEDGTYYVRYAAKENYTPSSDAIVTILAGRKLNVTFVVDDATLETEQVSWNGSIDALPNIPAKTGYDQTPPTWDKTLADLTGIQTDITVTAQYIINRYTVPLTPGEGYTLEAVGANQVNHGDSFTFKVMIAEGYGKTDEFAVKYNEGVITPNADGSYTVTVLTDLVSPVVLGVADNTAPTGEITIDTNRWDEFLNNITFGLFFKDTQSVEITAADAGSGVDTIHYYLAEAEMTLEEVKAISDWQEYTGSFDIEPNHEYIVYVKLTDNAGNVSYLNSNGVVLDNILPAISGIENGKTYCEAVEVTVDEAYVDTVTVNGETVTLADGKFTAIPATGEQTIVVTDKAGNRTEMTITVNDGHTWGEYTSNGDATCTADGTKTAKCQFCDATDTVVDEGSMLAHTYGEWADAKDGEHHIRTCSCGAAETEAHKWDSGKVTKEATTTEKGEKTYTCAVCGAVKTEEIPVLPETPQTGDTTSPMPWVALMFLSGVGLTCTTVFRKKKTAKK